jgi:hypothetical protein
VLPHYSSQDWHPFAARHWFMGDTRGDGQERDSVMKPNIALHSQIMRVPRNLYKHPSFRDLSAA